MSKSAEAFRTISEVAEVLGTPAHVLRFWESRFTQIRPLKRAGGRRYYRPADVALLAGIRKLLHDDGMTIRGVQKILREQGVRHVAQMSSFDAGEAAGVSSALAADGAGLAAALAGADGAWPASPDPGAAGAADALLHDPQDRPAEAPMLVDMLPGPLGGADNLHHLPDRAATREAPAEPGPEPGPGAAPEPEAHPPAAKLLRAMDAFHAYQNRAGLRAVYDRLSDLRDRVAAEAAKGR